LNKTAPVPTPPIIYIVGAVVYAVDAGRAILLIKPVPEFIVHVCCCLC
jgi:hypothetical protein